MPMIDAGDGCRINVQVDGPDNAPVLTLSNSLGANLHMWDVQMPAFTKHFRVVRYDRRGHGKSDVPAGAYSFEGLGRDVLAILDALKIKKTNWCGLSMGGMVGMWLGANAPNRMERIVLSNTSARFPSPAPWDERIALVSEKGVAPLADGTMERWFTAGFREKNPGKVGPIRDVFLKTSPIGYVGCGHAIRNMDHGDILKKISAPTLVIAGKHDMGTTVEMAEFIRDGIKGSKLVVLDAAHLANVEQPEAYAKAVLDHLLAK